MSGEYFLNKEQKRTKLEKEKEEKHAEANKKREEKRQQAFVPPEESKIGKMVNRSVSMDIEALKEKVKKKFKKNLM